MGRRQFFGWVEQINKEIEGTRPSEHSWAGTDHDPAWQEMRAARDRARGYRLSPRG